MYVPVGLVAYCVELLVLFQINKKLLRESFQDAYYLSQQNRVECRVQLLSHILQ